MLGNCVLKDWSYISEDTPVTLACQGGRRCRKSTRRRGTPAGAQGEKLCPLRGVCSQGEVVFGTSVWHRRSPGVYPVELFVLVGVVGRSFLFQRGRRERVVFYSSSQGFAAAGWRVPGKLLLEAGGEAEAALVSSVPACSATERRDGEAAGSGASVEVFGLERQVP